VKVGAVREDIDATKGPPRLLLGGGDVADADDNDDDNDAGKVFTTYIRNK
jgi:hypothetical protein